MFLSKGKLRYGNSNLVLDVDQGLVDYYRAMLPKTIVLQKQKYAAHISVVRKETPNMEFWKKYEGEEIDFIYSNEIRHGEIYYWIDVWSKRLEEIRVELGLINDSLYIQPPEGYIKTFHITLGNLKK